MDINFKATLFASVLFTQFALTAPAIATELLDRDGIRFELGAGGTVSPVYEGSSDYMLSPLVIVRVNSFKLGALRFGGGDRLGFKIGPSFNFIGERKVSDDIVLTGINDVDASFEAGLKFSYEWDYARVFAQARYGVVGHNALVGEVGVDAIFRPSPETTISIGPRLSFADSDYMDTYFSVPATATLLTPYTASGGLKSAGLEATIRYDFNEYWAFQGSAQWNRLLGDASDSPIVAAGSEDQFVAKLGFIRKFSIDF